MTRRCTTCGDTGTICEERHADYDIERVCPDCGGEDRDVSIDDVMDALSAAFIAKAKELTEKGVA